MRQALSRDSASTESQTVEIHAKSSGHFGQRRAQPGRGAFANDGCDLLFLTSEVLQPGINPHHRDRGEPERVDADVEPVAVRAASSVMRVTVEERQPAIHWAVRDVSILVLGVPGVRVVRVEYSLARTGAGDDLGQDLPPRSEPDPTLLSNVRFLAGYRRLWQFPQRDAQTAQISIGAAHTLGTAMRSAGVALGDIPSARAVVLHLIWRRAILCDLMSALANDTPLETPLSHTFDIRVGSTVSFDGFLCTVIELVGDAVVLVDGAKKARRVELLRDARDAFGSPADEAALTPLALVWADATDAQRDEERRKAEHVREMRTGFVSGMPTLAQSHEPRPEYNPKLTSTRERRRAKAAEVGVSVKTLKRWHSRFNEGEDLALLDFRKRLWAPVLSGLTRAGSTCVGASSRRTCAARSAASRRRSRSFWRGSSVSNRMMTCGSRRFHSS